MNTQTKTGICRIRDLNRAGDSFNEIASDRSKNAQAKRKALIALDSDIRDKLAQLEQVSPVRVLQNLSHDLRNSPGVQTRSNGKNSGMEQAVALVRGHAARLNKALAELHTELSPLPAFPAPVGIAATFSASILPNTIPYLLLAIFIECSGVFCFLLCVKYQRGLIMDHLALLEIEAQEVKNSVPAPHVGNSSTVTAFNGAGDSPHSRKAHNRHNKRHNGHARHQRGQK